MKNGLSRLSTPTTLLARLIEAPELVKTIRALPGRSFSRLIQRVGVEDAGELIAMATTDQLVAAFDEDLFTNQRPGERESFDAGRFIPWLEVLLEAGDDVAASKVSALSEDFVIQALSQILFVLDHEALLLRMGEGDRAAYFADKAIESHLSEEIDGYLLVSKLDDGWDAALALILALDRDQRGFLERVLDRCSTMASSYVEDLDLLTEALNDADSLAEDVEAEREERRGRQGFVEPQSARAFLALARQPLESSSSSQSRDPITAAYFRDLEVERQTRPAEVGERASSRPLQELLGEVDEDQALALPAVSVEGGDDPAAPFIEAMNLLCSEDQVSFGKHLEELGFLVNVLASGAQLGDDRRLSTAQAADAALLTVACGAMLKALDVRGAERCDQSPTSSELLDALRDCSADLLFRRASGWLASTTKWPAGFLRSRDELAEAIENRLSVS